MNFIVAYDCLNLAVGMSELHYGFDLHTLGFIRKDQFEKVYSLILDTVERLHSLIQDLCCIFSSGSPYFGPAASTNFDWM